jgi:glyoxylase-like metal-dependent hydrolase (beta-lactamase superfamily II)
MLCASEIESVAPGISLWRYYDPAVKTDLFSTAMDAPSGTYLIDPIPLAPEALADLRNIAGVVVTNENHVRASEEFAARFRVPVYSGASDPFPSGLTAVGIDGAAAGEVAIYSPVDGGCFVIGDALINFEAYGFSFLPAKYASNSKLMRRSLEKLLDYSFERMLFAHGIPIVSRARERLENLLKEGR